MGNTDELPFHIERTWNRNLPVYSEFKNNGMRKLTIVRRITGDVDSFKDELAKVCSNSEVLERQGAVMVKGMHAKKVKKWLLRLGF